MNKLKMAVLLVCGVLEASGASAATVAQPSNRLLITGSSTMAPMLATIAKRFQSLHPEVNIEVQPGGSERGVSDAHQGKADVGMVSRTLAEAEKKLYEFPIARDGVAIVINKNNPVSTLSNSQLIAIYTGKISNWRGVGGRDEPIMVFAGPAGRGSTELFIHYLGIRYDAIKVQRVIGDNPERLKATAEHPEAIVYVSVGEAERKAKAGLAVKLLPVDGVGSSSQNVRNGNFPISRPLILVTKELPKGLAKTFIEFALSPRVTDIIQAYDFVPYLD